jgi:hypothetical protein
LPSRSSPQLQHPWLTPFFTTSLEDSPPLRALPTSRSTQPLSRRSLGACAPSIYSQNTWSNHTTVPPPPTAAPVPPAPQTPNNKRPAHAPPPAPPAPQTNFQRPPPVLRDLPSTSREISQSLPSSRSHTPCKAPPPTKANTRGKLSPTPLPTHTPLHTSLPYAHHQHRRQPPPPPTSPQPPIELCASHSRL